ncbi:MAG: metal-dependent hydrolase [Candidatus Hydrogenedentes bacterium]|nr:metal-dependent hydrolase [Candidatus Hydrogenedentota bacterium]
MNGPIHFCTGYLAGRALGYREYRFEPLYIALAAYAPDFDLALRHVSPFFAHGIWTHTILGVTVMACPLALIGFACLRSVRSAQTPSLGRLWGLAVLGGLSHLLLDAFTYYESPADATHHMYFWPLWSFPWHINTILPAASYGLRVWIEVVYSILVAAAILGYLWAYRRQNPFRALYPRNWARP